MNPILLRRLLTWISQMVDNTQLDLQKCARDPDIFDTYTVHHIIETNPMQTSQQALCIHQLPSYAISGQNA